MWFLKVKFPMFPSEYWIYTVKHATMPHVVEHFFSLDALKAEAFPMVEIELMKRAIQGAYPGTVATPVECSSNKILTADMKRILNLTE
ncbi:hypothetical protein P106B_90 [Rhizobium phage vB_RglS_P106B]|uniref:Uncharacterized protein n=1 Tax=Rhizobium phage vB_RglS_P106B TaxID=1458697 RepID=W6E9U5_9CAUD|nr:hypothetical protein P106B_90 [Rhizobium phage vB_RglS_P106B]AHJ10773.1 hypothetical protein P106B_90 [Rhizobium phage vB_RglS_P106B]